MRKQGKIENRIIAGIVDIIVTGMIAIVFMYAAAQAFSKNVQSFEIMIPVVYFVYLLAMDLFREGQSIGRILVKERVIGKEEKAPSTVDFIVRNIIKTMPVLIIFLFPTLRILALGIAVAYILFPFFHKQHLALHDLVGETKVCANAWESVEEKVEYSQEKITLKEETAENSISLEEAKEDNTKKQKQEDNQAEVVKPGLYGVSGEYEEAFIPLTGEVVLGREYSCNLIFPGETLGISRRHCMVQYDQENKMFIIIDLNSTYGTFLGDGSRIPAGETMYLKEGEEFYIGNNERFRVGNE
ncbi:MAG: RDD family protein [Lachnospiraceae bacterium]|nr:RDD family protein [Lachnospiraceae bacterium]